MKPIYFFLLVSAFFPIQSVSSRQEDAGTIIRILKRSRDQKAVVREPALEKIDRSKDRFAQQLADDLAIAKDSNRITLLAGNLQILLRPTARIAPHLDGSVHQVTLPREMESTNPSPMRPVPCACSQTLTSVLLKQLAAEIAKYDRYGPLDYWFDESAETRKKIKSQNETYQAIDALRRVLVTVGEIPDIYKLEPLLKKVKTAESIFAVTSTMQSILGLPTEVYFNGRCGVGITRQMVERELKEKMKMAEEVREKMLKLLKENPSLDREQAMRLSVKKVAHVFEMKASRFQTIGYGSAFYPQGIQRYGVDALTYISEKYPVKRGGHQQGNFEALRAVMTGEFDKAFVQKIFENQVQFSCAKRCAIKIISNSGSKKFKEELLRLVRYTPTKRKSVENPDPDQDYQVSLRKMAALTLAACHGKDVLKELEAIEPLDPGKTGYYDELPEILNEIRGRYPK